MTQDLKRIIGLRIRARRLALELTQEQVAEAIIRTVETVSNIERGKAFPGLETLEQLCHVLDTPISSLFNDSDAMESSRQRTELRARLLAIADALSDSDLEIAVRQVEVLAQGRNRRI